MSDANNHSQIPVANAGQPSSSNQDDYLDPAWTQSDSVQPITPQSTPLDLPMDQPEEQPIPLQPLTIRPHQEAEPISLQAQETIPMAEVGVEQEMDPEVQEYMERVEKEKLQLNEPIVIHGQPVAQPPHWQPSGPQITLPTTRNKVTFGLTQSVQSSVRWLAEWCVRMIKKFQGRVVYSQAQEAE